MKTIETKIAKNGVMIIKLNGKRVSRQVAVDSLFEDSVGTTISNEQGHIFTCISNNEPTPAGFGQRVGYLLTDENGKSYIFNFMSEALNCIGNNYFPTCNIVGEKETPDFGGKRFSVTIHYKIQEAGGKLLKTEHARFATAADAANHIIAFVAAHPDYIYQDGVIADWNTKTTKYDLTAEDMLVAAEKISEVEVSEETVDDNAVKEAFNNEFNAINEELNFLDAFNKKMTALFAAKAAQNLITAAVKEFDADYKVICEKRDETCRALRNINPDLYPDYSAKRHELLDEVFAQWSKAVDAKKQAFNICLIRALIDKLSGNKAAVEETAKGDDDNDSPAEETVDADNDSPAEETVEEYLFHKGDYVNHMKKVNCTRTVINGEELLYHAGKLVIVRAEKYQAEIQFTCGIVAYYTFDRCTYHRWDEGDFWLEMAACGACTLEPVTNEIVSCNFEYPDKYNEFGEDVRKFNVGGEIVTFYKDRWVEIESNSLCAKITRTVYSDELRYNLEEWLHHDDNNTYFELSKYNISVEEFWAAMYRRGFMQRCNPFKITIEHADAPATTHEVMDLEIFYTRKGNIYTVALDRERKIVFGSLNHKHLQSFVNKIKLAFANADGVTISPTGAVEVITNDEADIQAICAEITRHAPEGWTITFDKQGNFFPVKFKGKQVATLDSLATQKFLSPEKFFEQFKPLVDKSFTPRNQFLADRYNELALLEEMREEIDDDDEQMKTLEEMIQQVKRDIAAEELAC